MFQDRLDSIATFIMEHNVYFDRGISNVWLDETTGYVSDDETAVFPADNLGDYFYLRLPKNIDFVYDRAHKFADCVDGIGAKSQVILVAVIKDGSADQLIENLINTLRNYREATVIVKSAIYQAAYVILQELRFINEENREAALQRIPQGSSFVSITFEITETVLAHKLNCIVNPCTC